MEKQTRLTLISARVAREIRGGEDGEMGEILNMWCQKAYRNTLMVW